MVKQWRLLGGAALGGLCILICWWIMARPEFPLPTAITQSSASQVTHAGSGYSYEQTFTFLGTAEDLVIFYRARGYTCTFDSGATMQATLQTPDGGWECLGTSIPQSRVRLIFPRDEVTTQPLPVHATVSWSDQLFR